MTARASFVLLPLALLCGCQDDPSPASTQPSASASIRAADTRSSPSGYGSAYADEDVAVAADYEEEAEKAISKSNYQDELAEIEEALGIPTASASASANPPPAAPSAPVAPSPGPSAAP